MDYTIVTHSQQKELVAEVKKLIAEGWEPLGGVTSNSFFYNQAMVKPKKAYSPGWDMPSEDTIEANKAAWSPPKELTGTTPANGVTNSPAKRSHKKKNP